MSQIYTQRSKSFYSNNDNISTRMTNFICFEAEQIMVGKHRVCKLYSHKNIKINAVNDRNHATFIMNKLFYVLWPIVELWD